MARSGRHDHYPHHRRGSPRHARPASAGGTNALWCVRACRTDGDPPLSLSRLNHWLPRGQTHPAVVQGTAEFHDEIADALLPQADPVFHDTAALDATVDTLDP